MEESKKSRFDRFFERIESHGFDSLTPAERGAFALQWLYREVNNGGFDQFFFNDAGKLAPDALYILKIIGADKTADILQQAMSIFPDGIVPVDQKIRREFMCDSLTSEQQVLLSELDAKFYEQSEPVENLINKYIKEHPQEFPT